MNTEEVYTALSNEHRIIIAEVRHLLTAQKWSLAIVIVMLCFIIYKLFFD